MYAASLEIAKLYLLSSLLSLWSGSVAFECQQYTSKFRSGITEYISSPKFPLPRPAGNYVCEYILNPRKFSVRIVFSDFFLYGSSVQESLMPDCLLGDGDYIKILIGNDVVGTYCAASKSRPPPIAATDQKFTLRYVVRSNTTTSRPGFHATYEFNKDPNWLDKPKVFSEYILSNGDGHSEMTLMGPGIFDILLLIQSSNFVHFVFDATNNISSIDVLSEEGIILYGGSTSNSLILDRRTSLDAFDLTSPDTTMTVTMNLKLNNYQAVSLQFVYAFCTKTAKSVGGSCPSNYFPCERGFYCIPSRLLCDSFGHCPDNSDEKYCNEPCFQCRNGGLCNQKTGICQCFDNFYGSQCHFFACGEANCNHGVCKIVDLEGNYRCDCHMGYSGEHCDVPEQEITCPCERKNRCQKIVSESMGTFCNCYDNYYGPNCEFEYNWNIVYVEEEPIYTLEEEEPEDHSNRRVISKLWVILLTAFGIFFLIVFCCCIAKRGSARASRSTRENHRNTNGAEAARNASDASQVNNQAPPLIRSSSSLFAMITAWRRATMRPPTPPPSYDAIEPMYCMVNTDIAMNVRGNAEYSCTRHGHHHDTVCGTITRESSGLPDVIVDGDIRSHIGQSIVSQV
ncbi:uncharacterized protein LOC117108578 [Anneissia japonica]|uniref:uncharacterized protein LOC117108578 n=1 Tax=Anneissia japonica TaxID=1529436 RepID=UPI001425AB2E|nr:uncharacterized protein LOC117108578 [Anneissia japonica]XP_033106532.1 uncharacterized protein LOC117108578 [Anneissia japonica]